MRIFLDIGAHTGQSLREAKRWDFDRIVSFEPCSQCWPALDAEAATDPRISIERFGLFDRHEQRTLYACGKGASLWWRAMKRGGDTPTEQVQLKRASDWFAEHLSPSDTVIAKLNCEGSEVAILNDLLDSGEFSKITRALVRLDGLKIAELSDSTQQLLKRLGAYIESKAVNVERYMPLAAWIEQHRDLLNPPMLTPRGRG